LLINVKATGGGKALAKELGIPFLGAVPLDPRIGIACDYGESFFDSFADSPACRALQDVVRNLAYQLRMDTQQVVTDELA
jgi:hypothetical protein